MPELQSQKADSNRWKSREFLPHPLLHNNHLMTIVPGFLPRQLGKFRRSGVARFFKIDEKTKLLGHIHLQNEPRKTGTAIVLHGLEGSSESSHVLGIGNKMFACGYNVLRLNMRTCGGSMPHAESLYHAGLWQDLQAVMKLLNSEDGLNNFSLVGYSLGGNLVLNSAAHHTSEDNFRIAAVCAVSPSINLAECVEALEHPDNQIYQNYFLRSLKQKILAKSRQYPDVYKTDSMKQILTIRQFDNQFTAPHGGFGTADRYYREASSMPLISKIAVPTLIICAKDDPLVPINSFQKILSSCPQIEFLITEQGGHGGFYQSHKESESCFDHFWAENRVVEYIREVSRNLETDT